jgi:uncharacterized membrane protein YkoI
MKGNLRIQTVAAAFLLAAVTTSALTAAEQTEAQVWNQAKISKSDAERTALGKVPNGRVESAEPEKEHGELVRSFHIAQPNKKNIAEARVDAKTGRIAAGAEETLKDQAQEANAERAKKH